MDIDDLRKRWHTIDVPERDIRDIELKASAGHLVVTMRDRLIRITRYLTVMCLAGILCLLPAVSDFTLMVVLVDLFFIAMGVVNIVQLHMLSRLDPSVLTVSETLSLVLRYETVRCRKRLVGITIAVPLVIYMVLTIASSYGSVIIPSCIVGALCGCVAAILINRRATRLIRGMKSELSGHKD